MVPSDVAGSVRFRQCIRDNYSSLSASDILPSAAQMGVSAAKPQRTYPKVTAGFKQAGPSGVAAFPASDSTDLTCGRRLPFKSELTRSEGRRWAIVTEGHSGCLRS